MLSFQHEKYESRESYCVRFGEHDFGYINCKTLVFHNNKYEFYYADDFKQIAAFMRRLGATSNSQLLRFEYKCHAPYYQKYDVYNYYRCVGEINCKSLRYGQDRYEEFVASEVEQMAKFMKELAGAPKVDWKRNGF